MEKLSCHSGNARLRAGSVQGCNALDAARLCQSLPKRYGKCFKRWLRDRIGTSTHVGTVAISTTCTMIECCCQAAPGPPKSFAARAHWPHTPLQTAARVHMLCFANTSLGTSDKQRPSPARMPVLFQTHQNSHSKVGVNAVLASWQLAPHHSGLAKPQGHGMFARCHACDLQTRINTVIAATLYLL